MLRAVWIGWVSLILAGCGGSGDSNTPPSSPAPLPTTPDFRTLPATVTGNGANLYAQTDNRVGQSVSLAATSPDSSKFVNILWQQLSGPQVEALALNSQVIGFDAAQTGTYQFRFTANNDKGQSISETISIDIEANDREKANIRLDHAAVETAKVSLRVDGDSQKTIDQISWSQTAGPIVSPPEEQGNLLFFDAPAVNSDTVLEFEATLTYSDGSTAKDTALIVVMDIDINTDGFFPGASDRVVTTDMFAYQPDSPHAEALESCIYNNLVDRSCTFQQLPLIGQQTDNPDVADIMQRVLVSHAWMGERFEQYLNQSVAAQDMLQLLRATTAIVISYDVRPSFYWSATGAIYLDANNFWVTPQERDTLNDQPDFRSSFGNDLQFFIPWRYVKNNAYYLNNGSYPVAERQSKTFTDLEASITWLMYHELGHANDFFPPAKWQSISRSTSPLRYISDNEPNSTAFSQSYPLHSTEMASLAQVSFAGSTATEAQKNLNAQDVSLFFEPDDAPAYYSYSTIREDYATLFERFMMSYRMGVSADVAVVPSDSDNFEVVWGQRDRFNEARIQPRVEAVVTQILPAINVSDIQPNLPQPQLMTPGLGWVENLQINTRVGGSKKPVTINNEQALWIEHRHQYPTIPQVK